MAVTHEYKIVDLVAIAEKDGLTDVVSAIKANLVSSETFSHTFTRTVDFDEVNQERLETPYEETVTEDKTLIEIHSFTKELDTSSVSANTFVDFTSLTEAEVLAWVGTNPEAEASNEAVIADKKDRILNPKKYEVVSKGLPWVVSETIV